MTAIFYGLGLFGRVGLTTAPGIALVVLALQLWAAPPI